MSNEYIKKFYEEACTNLDGEYKIVVEADRDIDEEWIEHDVIDWQIEDCMKSLVEELSKNTLLTFEEKVLKLYEFICLHYVYDVNVLYFFRTDTTDPENIKHIACDWYGRIIKQDWYLKRQNHNRRICYEFSRFYAKAINTLIDNKNDLEAVILGDRENNHYVVGLTGKDYSIILDQDDFNQIKDLTRVKLGLTIKGIHIFRDDSGKFTKILENYNNNKLDEVKEISDARKKYLENNDIIAYINVIIDVMRKNNIDAQGCFEYVRITIEKLGMDFQKIWKEDISADEKRYERCLYFNVDDKNYLLDSIEKKLKEVTEADLRGSEFVFSPEENEYKYYGG